MKRGCLQNVLFGVVLLLIFGSSTYFWFTFFVKGRSLPTPNLIGRSVSDARKVTQDLGVDLLVDDQHRRNDDKVPVGHIVWQNRTPGATSFIKRGSTMRVELSAGPLVLRVPDLEGASAGTAILRLGQQNLKPGTVTYVASAMPGVLAADPPKTTVVAPQSAVALLVGVAPPPSEYVMPDLIDRSLEHVRPALEARGLHVATVKFEAYPGIADGIIIRQYPLRGAAVSTQDPISVVVSRQEEGGFAAAVPPAATQPQVDP
ncbi:MAG TPA: PASTA domain-containing protein [Thermoanaerobaculia bacterium]|jgi:serine/threonine-protein kinase|nr:PASTA domain-containing protein [Thermoanaerobaculia bacterium]